MRKILPFLALLPLICAGAYAVQQPQSAGEVMAAAKAAAAQQHKIIFLVFGASWCVPCHEMEAFMADRKIRPILEKYFIVSDLNVEEERGKHPELNSPGADKLVGDYGGKDGGVPFIVFLDDQGRLLINSNRPLQGKDKGGNVGYPAAPEEIAWFMQMLRKTLPTLAESDAHTIETWLRKASR